MYIMFSKAESVKNSNSCKLEDDVNVTLPLFVNLEKKYGVIGEHLRDSSNILKGIYCQDSYMKDVFNFYPDRLCIDVTHKYFGTDIFMFIFICEDSNGHNEIISLSFLTGDDSESFLWVLNTFKKHNPNWRKTKIIALDPEIKHKDIIRNIFPTPYMMICFHHAFKSFRKGMERVKIQNALSSEQVQYAIELFKSMYNAYSQAEYELYYQQFLVMHSMIVSYFQEIWLTSQHLWRTGLDFFHENLFSSLNCRLENLDKTFKSLFISEDDLLKFIKTFFMILSIKRGEKTNSVLYANPVLYSRFCAEHQISKSLTSYAAKFVIDQYDLSSEIHMDCSILSDNYFFDNLGSPVNASISMCQCQFFLYTFLPCRHIFAVRKILSLATFDETLIEHTWTSKYYQSTLSSLQGTISALNSLLLKESVPRHECISHLLEFSLPSLFSSLQISESRIDMLTQLISLWRDNKNVYLQFEGVEHGISLQETHCNYLTTEKTLPVCKTESEISVDQASVLLLNKPDFFVRKPHISSKLFKTEYASASFIPVSTFESHALISSPAFSEMNFRQNKWNFKSKVLDANHVNYAYLCRIICDSKETCIDWLRQMELICTNMLCPTCGCGMTMKLVPRLSDGAVWVCSNDAEVKKSCSRRCSVRRGSWFELTNMSFEQILTFCYMWINGFSQSQILSETGISTATYISWNKLNKRVCEECLMEDSNYLCISKMDSASYAQILEAWLQKCGGEDSFLKFLQDANAMHRKDSVKHSMG